MHPQYNENTMSHDFCLVSVPNLINNASPQAIFEPACLPECHVAGIGTLYSGGPIPLVLQEVDVSLMSEQYCVDNSYMSSSQLDNSMFCAGELDNDGNGLTDGGKDSCQGDSGGPLICEHNGIPFLTGVVSWGFGCADEGAPGVYGDVSIVKDWAMNFFADGLPSCKYNDTIAYNPDVEYNFMNSNSFTISESGGSIGLTIPENYGDDNDHTVTINRSGSTKAINLYIDKLDLEPGYMIFSK
ncbi:unnamed protein product [Oikopleura dioica]|uniref:Peptidase S1 domain-containing protein n=1 Tax=Oikopleura dioica TaxID=34765 RepID=E4XJT4_OIKDI|nr:unnamed protein product [Oikopleura dioica]